MAFSPPSSNMSDFLGKGKEFEKKSRFFLTKQNPIASEHARKGISKKKTVHTMSVQAALRLSTHSSSFTDIIGHEYC